MERLADEERVGRQNPIFCVLDEAKRSRENKALWTPAQLKAARIFKERVYNAYGCRPNVYLNIRKQFLSVKVAAPTISEKNLATVLALNTWCDNNNVSVSNSDGGILYHIN